MLLEIKDLVKYYGERKILELSGLSLYSGDRLALTGRNGSGKTTLLRMIARDEEPDTGRITVKGSVAMITQTEDEQEGETDIRIAGRLGLSCEAHSGGERVKERIARAFSCPADILLADEPTTNLDINGISCLEELLLTFKGGLVIVSHDRALLKALCNKVLEIDRGKCRLYGCGYEEYLVQKELESISDKAQYEQYISERDRLKRAAAEIARKSSGIKRPPKRMGNSEARLHKMGGQGAKGKLDRSAKAALSRLEQLEKVEKPWEQREITFDILPGAVRSPVLITVNDASKAFDRRSVLEHCSFIVPNNKKTALTGPNGSGKTTLLDMIASKENGIEACRSLKIGYFRQDMSGVDDDKSVLENALSASAYGQQFTRTILARLLFSSADVNKKARVISGGERIKLALAKIILSDFNLLVLDEPTNYLDIESRVALEHVLCAYPGAVLFVSHDREFIRNVADRVVVIKNKTAVTFEDTCPA